MANAQQPNLTTRQQIDLQRLKLEENRTMLEGQIALAVNGIKNLILINGAAAIAILAFLGHLGASKISSVDIGRLSSAMLIFGYGVASGALCSFLAYLFQTIEREVSGMQWLKHALRGAALLAAASGVALFVFGLITAARAVVAT